jgi:hypothetical protein
LGFCVVDRTSHQGLQQSAAMLPFAGLLAFAVQYLFIAARRPSLFRIKPIRDTLGYSKVLFPQTL